MRRNSLLLRDSAGKIVHMVQATDDDEIRPLGAFEVVVDSPRIVILQQAHPGGDESDRGRVLMAGEIISATTVLDIVNVIAASRWAGSLHIYGIDSHRMLAFDGGALKVATSDHPDDRLNRILVRMGIMNRSSIESVMRYLEPPDRLGKLLVEQGYVSRQQLFELLNKQAEEVFFSAIGEREGSYAFVVGEESVLPRGTITHISVQELLLRGAERLDSLEHFSAAVPDMELCPLTQAGVELTKLDPKTRLILALSDGERSLREIATETWLGKFETMKIARDLVRKGFVSLKDRSPSARESIRRLGSTFNELLRHIFSVTEQFGSVTQTRDEINRWLENRRTLEFLPGGVASDGSIHLDPAVISGRESDDRQLATVIREALQELVSFALFAAALSLPAEQERQLSKEVYSRLRVQKH